MTPSRKMYDVLTRLHRQGLTGFQASAAVRAEMTSPDDLAAAVRTVFVEQDPLLMGFVMGVLSDVQDPALVPVLCEIVDRGDARLGVEDAIEILGEIGDPHAVPSLATTLLSPPIWDFDGYAGEKAVVALDKIGTPEARAAIRAATSSVRRRVWQAAIRPALAHDRESFLALAQRLVSEDPGAHQLEIVLRALADIGGTDAWRIIEAASNSDDEDDRVLAKELLHNRRSG